jgi:hypothetical protein
MKAPFLWAQLTAGRLPCSGPRSRTPPRSSSLCQVGKEASTTLPQMAQHGGLVRPHYNCNVEGDRSSHDMFSPADGGAAAGNYHPFEWHRTHHE